MRRSHLEKTSFEVQASPRFRLRTWTSAAPNTASITFTFTIRPGNLEASLCRFLITETKERHHSVGADSIGGIRHGRSSFLPFRASPPRSSFRALCSQCCAPAPGSPPRNQGWPQETPLPAGGLSIPPNLSPQYSVCHGKLRTSERHQRKKKFSK